MQNYIILLFWLKENVSLELIIYFIIEISITIFIFKKILKKKDGTK